MNRKEHEERKEKLNLRALCDLCGSILSVL
jgi:hypothetical protein